MSPELSTRTNSLQHRLSQSAQARLCFGRGVELENYPGVRLWVYAPRGHLELGCLILQEEGWETSC